MRGGVRLAEPVPAVGVDQRDARRRPPGGGLAEQVDGGQRAAGAPPMMAMTGRRFSC
jgi:hypothetical protein